MDDRSVEPLGYPPVPARIRRGKQEENKRRTRATREEHERAHPMLLPCIWLAPGSDRALGWLPVTFFIHHSAFFPRLMNTCLHAKPCMKSSGRRTKPPWRTGSPKRPPRLWPKHRDPMAQRNPEQKRGVANRLHARMPGRFHRAATCRVPNSPPRQSSHRTRTGDVRPRLAGLWRLIGPRAERAATPPPHDYAMSYSASRALSQTLAKAGSERRKNHRFRSSSENVSPSSATTTLIFVWAVNLTGSFSTICFPSKCGATVTMSLALPVSPEAHKHRQKLLSSSVPAARRPNGTHDSVRPETGTCINEKVPRLSIKDSRMRHHRAA